MIWVHELRGHTPSQIHRAFETYRRDVSGVFPSSHDILKILRNPDGAKENDEALDKSLYIELCRRRADNQESELTSEEMSFIELYEKRELDKALRRQEKKLLALPDPDEERYQMAIKNYSMTYSDAIFVEKRSEEKGLYLSPQAKDAIERAKQAHADSLLSPEEKKAKEERIAKMFEILRNTGVDA